GSVTQTASESEVLLITGPAAAGKSTLADHWARSRSDPCMHVSLDDVRDWVKSGYANPEDGWSSAAEAQYVLARRCTALCVREYVREGYTCVIDDAVFPDWPAVSLEGWRSALGDLTVTVVVLMPSFEVLAERNENRSGHRRLSHETLKVIYDQMSGWRDLDVPLIDNTGLGTVETVELIDRMMSSACDCRPANRDL
ncbi:AAA family ATPase, partial [Streptomyces sp. NPDC004752]